MEDKLDRSTMLGRSWFITGVCGTVGRRLLERILTLDPKRVTGVDNNESALFYLYDQFRTDDRVKLYCGDLRDPDGIRNRMDGAEIVIHTAALKHVYLSEESPVMAVSTNVLGTQNVIDAARATGIERLLVTSSDKAVNPTNVMGTSKLMAERLVSAANAHVRPGKQILASTRFGNVLGSRGSVIPIFLRQIEAGGPVTVTDPGMTRFIMTMTQAVDLVLESVFLARGGEIFVTKMPVVCLADLVAVLIEQTASRYGFRSSDIKIEIIGPRPGEKMYEELMNEEEIRRVIELEKYFVIKPAILSTFRQSDYVYPDMDLRPGITQSYNSKVCSPMTRDELKTFFQTNPEVLAESARCE